MLRKLLTFTMLCLVTVSYGFAQSGTLTGTVTDSQSGETLPASNVFIPELDRGASTDTNGNFEIVNIPPGTYTIRVSYIGYSDHTREVEVGANEETVVNITLQPSATNLEEVVVVGFGETRQRDLTGSVSSVSSDDIEEVHATTFESSLQGKTAGVQVTNSSGVLGAPVSVRVRGTTSINASSQPLYVVDGVPMTDAGGSIGNNLGLFGGTGSNPLLNIDSDNIKSIQVLKSATAAAVYGARGSNGVVLVETKSGRAGDVQVEVGISAGFTEPTEEYETLNGQQFQEMANYAIEKRLALAGFPGLDPELTSLAPFYTDPSQVASTNWPALVTRTGNMQNYNASVSGGSSQTQFYIAGSYSSEQGFARPNELKQFSAQAKVDHSFNEQLNVGLSISPSQSLNNRIFTQNAVAAPYTSGALYAPVIPQFYPNGDINDAADPTRAPGNTWAAFTGTPYGNAEGIDVLQTSTQINATSYVDYNFTENLSFKTDFAVQFLQVEEEYKNADYATDGYPVGTASANNNQIRNYNWNNTLTYTNDWQDHSLTAVVGMTFQQEESTSINAAGNTYASNQFKNLASAAVVTAGGGSATSFTFQNNLARINYKFKDRYLLTLTGSYNGSSRFSEDNRYGFFPAASAGWIISDEPFLRDVDWLSFLKLRAGYGVVGNANINNFVSLPLLSTGAYNQAAGLNFTSLPNSELKWERTAQLDLGLDYGFWENRIRGTIAYFHKETDDLLLGVPISATNGFNSHTQNIGALTNSGVEFDITADIITGDFSWSLNANISTINNEVTELPENGQPGDRIIQGQNIIQEGEPLGAFYLVEYAGVNPDNGDAQFVGPDGNVSSDYNLNARSIQGDPFEDFYGGFGTNLSYKRLSLNVNFNYSYGNDIYWQDGEFLRTNMNSLFNQDVSQLDYWTPDNTDASVPEPRFLINNGGQSSTRYLEDGSYLRLKSATLGYTLPRDWVSGYDVRVYAQGTNLLTWDNYRGLDPEVATSATSNLQGSVFFQPPQQRTIQFGIDLGF